MVWCALHLSARNIFFDRIQVYALDGIYAKDGTMQYDWHQNVHKPGRQEYTHCIWKCKF